jgi:hypothetical protein
MSEQAFSVTAIGEISGRALYIDRQGRLYISRLYDILRSEDQGMTWQLDCTIPTSRVKLTLAKLPLVTRLLRYNVATLQMMEDGTRIASAREGLFRAGPNEKQMKLVFQIKRGSRPWNICIDNQRVLFGEYGDSFHKLEVFIYVSEDGGRTFEVGHVFPRGSIRHVHNVVYDPYLDHYWVLVGDYGEQPGIGVLSKDLKNIEWLRRGDQMSRVVQVILKEDCMYFGTDSESEPNHIIRMDKKSGRIKKILQVEGTSLFAAAFGPVLAISTCMETGTMSPSRDCSLYLSRDGDAWTRTHVHKKDRLGPIFQFGTLVLPYGCCERPIGMFSGQAVVGAHNCVTLLDFGDHEAI